MYDVIIIGGGTSGLMAAVSAARQNASVLLLDKNPALGKKLLLTGGTRCNVTNARQVDDIIAHIPGNGRFLHSAFSQFDNTDIIQFFTSRGVPLKEEDHGRLFPTTDSAKTIVQTFIDEIKSLSIRVQTNARVASLIKQKDHVQGVELTTGEQFFASSIVLATGGKSYPKTGSTGDGYHLAKQLGHTITPLFATEVPLTSDEPFIQQQVLRGLSLRDIDLSVLNKKGKAVVTHRMDMIFTHFGISGPAVLRCSSFVHQQQQQQQTTHIQMKLDVLPHVTESKLFALLQRLQKDNPKRSIKNSLKELLFERYIDFICMKTDISSQTAINQLSSPQLESLVQQIKQFKFTVNGSLPIEKGFVTGGGVSLKEIQPKTMQSKLVSNVFFCGELLDIHGYTGGYNITAAFVTGHVAGKAAALYSTQH